MSKIEVNAIEPQSGTTLTIGASGDTVTLAAGATSTGFGATYNGAVNWSSTVRTSNFTAVSGNGYFCNTTGGAFTVTLPASPSFGDIVAIKDSGSYAATNNITIARNGSNIENNASNAFINIHGSSTTLVYANSTSGWLVVDSGSVADFQSPQFITATGGTVLTCGNYKTHIFTASGCFVVSSGGNDLGSNSVEYMVVAGGGGGQRSAGGGGGAGGFRQNYPSPAVTGLPVTATTYPITVGAGGAAGNPGGPSCGVTKGGSSIFSTITSAGGGTGDTGCSKKNGGSGGGTGDTSPANIGTGNSPPVSPSQGNPGGVGAGYSAPAAAATAGGGGGAGATGNSAPTQTQSGSGGTGSYWPNPAFGPTAPSYGTPGPVSDVRYFAGGGGGGTYINASPGAGGAGGGGAGTKGGPGVATTNTGGGGGGGNHPGGAENAGGAGGSGIVVIRYKYQ